MVLHRLKYIKVLPGIQLAYIFPIQHMTTIAQCPIRRHMFQNRAYTHQSACRPYSVKTISMRCKRKVPEKQQENVTMERKIVTSRQTRGCNDLLNSRAGMLVTSWWSL